MGNSFLVNGRRRLKRRVDDFYRDSLVEFENLITSFLTYQKISNETEKNRNPIILVNKNSPSKLLIIDILEKGIEQFKLMKTACRLKSGKVNVDDSLCSLVGDLYY